MAERQTSQGKSRRGQDQEMESRPRSQEAREPGGELSRRDYSPSLGLGSPFALMRRMADEMDRLFEDVWFAGRPSARPGLMRSGLPAIGQGMWAPQVEVLERGDRMVVRADLPGLKKEDVNIEIEEGALVIEGERKQEREEERQGFYRSERFYGNFYRAIPLPEGVSGDEAQATFRDGVLEVTLPLPAEQQHRGRKVEIQ